MSFASEPLLFGQLAGDAKLVAALRLAEGSFGYIRWHFHEEYELHLILETSSKMFVGDYIGRFKLGNLVLTGPRLPHNWISTDLPETGIEERDLAMQLTGEPIKMASELIPELCDALPLLERAKQGVEFDNITHTTHGSMKKYKQTQVCHVFLSLSIFYRYSLITQNIDYSLASNCKVLTMTQHFSEVVDYISENYSLPFTMAEIAEKFNMNESRF